MIVSVNTFGQCRLSINMYAEIKTDRDWSAFLLDYDIGKYRVRFEECDAVYKTKLEAMRAWQHCLERAATMAECPDGFLFALEKNTYARVFVVSE